MPLEWFYNKKGRPYINGQKRRRFGVVKVCPCGTHFFVVNESKDQICCSWKCRKKYLIHKNTGIKHSIETKRKLSEIKKSQHLNGKYNLNGKNNPNWKGGITMEAGRILESQHHTHPHADTEGRVSLHRLIVEKVIGRYLKSYEIVHHIDGNPHNNLNNNLLVCTQSYHVTLHNKQRGGGSNSRKMV